MASLQHLGGDRWRVQVRIDGRVVSRRFDATNKRDGLARSPQSRRHCGTSTSSTPPRPPADIDRWYGELAKQGATPAGIVVAHRHLRAVLRFGYKRPGLPHVATDRADPGQHEPPEIRPPKPAAVQAMLTALPIADRDWARAVALLAFTGARRSEVVGLRCVIDGGTLTIRHSVIEPRDGGLIVRP